MTHEWTTPTMSPVVLSAEVTAYVNTDLPGDIGPERPYERRAQAPERQPSDGLSRTHGVSRRPHRAGAGHALAGLARD